jgi:DNA polymerase III epsilon subunit-like protein
MIVVDTETTGFSPHRHAIVSIGAVEFHNPENQFYIECQPWNGATVDPEALAINGFKHHDLFADDRPKLSEAITAFFEWRNAIERYRLAGQNPNFDRGFFEEALRLTGLDYRMNHHWPDLRDACLGMVNHLKVPAPQYNDKDSYKLDAILPFVGMPPEPAVHNALTGAKLEAEAFQRLWHGTHLLEEYAHFPVPDYLIRCHQ